MLLNKSLMVSRLAVGVPQFMSAFKLLPPKFNLVLLVSNFCGLTLQTILLYATSAHLSPGICCLFMKKHESVPMLHPGIPCASCPISFPKECPHYFFIWVWRSGGGIPVVLQCRRPGLRPRSRPGIVVGIFLTRLAQEMGNCPRCLSQLISLSFCLLVFMLMTLRLVSWLILCLLLAHPRLG